MKLHATSIPGCFGLELVEHRDARGTFVKTFRGSTFGELGLETYFKESFFSTSTKGVLRGMHFQLPPEDGAKLICCISGEALDVALDLRVGSPSFGKAVSFPLSSERATAVYIPRGVAHGFLATGDHTTLVYSVSSEYAPALDAGIRWDSFDLDWGITQPVLSARDALFPTLAEFSSPFRFAPTEVSA
jgi:dTDP-4-dehydrorhamnose 3,5-epimerase